MKKNLKAAITVSMLLVGLAIPEVLVAQECGETLLLVRRMRASLPVRGVRRGDNCTTTEITNKSVDQ